VNLPGSEPFNFSTYLAGKLVRNRGARFQRIVMSYKNLTPVDLSAVNFENAILEYVRIVIKIVRRKLPGNLDDLPRNLGAPQACEFGVDLLVVFFLTGDAGSQP
jgi:hypothetical protein